MAGNKKPETDGNFVFFFLSQAALNVGGYLQMLSVAALMMKLTNSGIKTGFTILCAPLPSLLLSLPAGSAGDRFSPKKLAVALDFFKGLITLLFIGCKSPISVNLCLLAFYTLDAFYNPAKNKLLSLIVPKDQLITKNAILNGSYGLISILSPAMIGVFIHVFGVQKTFFLHSCLLFTSSLLILGIHTDCSGGRTGINNLHKTATLAEGIRYCLGTPKLRSFISVSALFDMCTLCVNIAFYSLAFDILKVSGRCWGLMLSTVYGMNVFAMLLLIYKKKQFEKKPMKRINGMLLILSAIWFFYGFTTSLVSVFAAEVIEGLCIALCNTLLVTELLKSSKKEYTARIMSIRDFCSNFLKITGIAFSYFLLLHFNPRALFLLFAAILLLYAAELFFHTKKADKRRVAGR